MSGNSVPMPKKRTAIRLPDADARIDAIDLLIHELRAPIRTVRHFADALRDEYSASLDTTGSDYVSRITEGSRNLGHLVGALVEFTRLDPAAATFDTVDLAAVVSEAHLQLAADVEAAEAELTVAKGLPSVTGYRPALALMFRNLIANAIKFSVAGRAPLVRIDAGCDAGKVVIRIKDNGIGIAEADHARMFEPLVRLHPGDDFSGSGIGLAVVAKAVAIHRGSIAVISAEGAGAIFEITLPASAP